jgi:tetratricopeptide (TPR) repeat protein
MTLGAAYALDGRTAEAMPLLDAAVAAHRALGVQGSRSLFLTAQGEGALLDGNVHRAADIAAEALDFSERFGERGYHAWTVLLLADIAARRAPVDPATAETHYRAALTAAESLGMRPLAARCLLGLGELYQDQDDRQQARDALTCAVTAFTTMQMSLWLARGRKRLSSLR